MGRTPVIVTLVVASLLFVGAVALAQENGGQYETTQQYVAEPPAATAPEPSQYTTGPSTTALPPPTTPEATTMAQQYLDRLGGRLPETQRGELPSTGGPGGR
jgi:hypothetical protein